jgi:hypothetical protein
MATLVAVNDLWQPIRFDREMIRKDDRPGSRSTSDPTASGSPVGGIGHHFSTGLTSWLTPAPF